MEHEISEKSFNSTSAATSLKSAIAHVFRILVELLPRWLRTDKPLSSKKLHSTSYLDALRGYAALFVGLSHRNGQSRNWFFNLPFVNIFKSGRAMVTVFFVISGFVLSQGLLDLARKRECARLIDRLASATLRRYLRLYLSVFAATFVAMLMVHFGGWRWPHCPEQMPLRDQLSDWLVDCTRVGNPFRVTGFYNKPGPNVANSHYIYILWTIPAEYCGSMVVYGFCAATCKMSSRNRMASCCILVVLCYVWEAIYAALFLMGAFLSELSLKRESEHASPQLPGLGPTRDDSQTAKRAKKALYIGCLVMGILLLSRNDGPPSKNGAWPWPWPFLNDFMPLRLRKDLKPYFHPSFGAFLLILALSSYPDLRKPLEWRFPQYLGEVSFGVYVTHVQVLYLDQKTIKPWRRALLGESLAAEALELLFCFPILLWAAELFTKVDARSVGFGRWLESKLCAAPD